MTTAGLRVLRGPHTSLPGVHEGEWQAGLVGSELVVSRSPRAETKSMSKSRGLRGQFGAIIHKGVETSGELKIVGFV